MDGSISTGTCFKPSTNCILKLTRRPWDRCSSTLVPLTVPSGSYQNFRRHLDPDRILKESSAQIVIVSSIGASSQTIRGGQEVKRRHWRHNLANTKDCGKHRGGGEFNIVGFERPQRCQRFVCICVCVRFTVYPSLCVRFFFFFVRIRYFMCVITRSNLLDSEHSCALRLLWF